MRELQLGFFHPDTAREVLRCRLAIELRIRRLSESTRVQVTKVSVGVKLHALT